MVSLENLSPAQDIVAKDFYLSFMHSQGNQALQFNIFSFMLDSYRKQGLKLTDDELDTSEDWLKIKAVPGRHGAGSASTLDAVTIEFEGKRMAEQLANILRLDMAVADEACISEAFGFVIEQDLEYQKQKRFIGNDQHASYFRRHVVLRASTGRQSLDEFYAAMVTCEPHIEQSASLASLEHTWESNHPNQSFYPGEW